MRLGNTQRKIMDHAYRNAGGWFSIARGESDLIRSADRLVSRGLLRRASHGGPQYRADPMRSVLAKIHNVYAGDPFGVDARTIPPAWCDALRRTGAPV